MVKKSRACTVTLVALQISLVFVWVSTQNYRSNCISNYVSYPCRSHSCQKLNVSSAGSNDTDAQDGSSQSTMNNSVSSLMDTRPKHQERTLQIYLVPKSMPSQTVHKAISNVNGLVAKDSGKIFVSVKTASSIQAERLPPLLSTWLQMFNGSQVHIVTDTKHDSSTRRAEDLGMTVIQSNCSVGHGNMALCCKSGVEYEQYYAAVEGGEDYDWFCHFDDDVYVNVPNLVKTLKQYDHNENIYLGHYYIKWGAKQVTNKYVMHYWSHAKRNHTHNFYYALGPAYCISKELMTKLPPFFRGASTFASTCNKTGLPDDATVGIIIEHYFGYLYFEVGTMMNELDRPRSPGIIATENCKKLVTVGYPRKSYYYAHKKRHLKYTLQIPLRSPSEDPTGFLSLHCFLHPWIHWCS